MSERVDDLVTAIRALTVRELAELNRKLLGGFGGLGGVREPRRPKPPPPNADAEDHSTVTT